MGHFYALLFYQNSCILCMSNRWLSNFYTYTQQIVGLALKKMKIINKNTSFVLMWRPAGRDNEEMICAIILQDHGVKEDELQSILNYLLTMHEVGICACSEERHYHQMAT